jgi:hypothetical protein
MNDSPTGNYLDPLNFGATKVDDVGGRRGERSGLQPEHLVHGMLLHRAASMKGK